MRYWVKNRRKIYRQLLWDKHTQLIPEHKSAQESIGFFWTVEKGSAGKGPIGRKTKYRMTKKGNIGLSIMHYSKWSYPNNNDVLVLRFLKLSIYDGKEKTIVPGT